MAAKVKEGVRVPLRYGDGTKPPGIFFALSHAESTCAFAPRETEIINARQSKEEFSLDSTGFTLVNQPTRVTDFEDVSQIEDIYVPEVQDLVTHLTGASRVIVFHRLGRWENGEQLGKRQPAGNPHIDYTDESFRHWAIDELGHEEAEKLLKKRWAAINVWRGIRPVERRPLAVADGRTIKSESMVAVPIHDRPGEPTPLVGINILHDDDQRWYYFPDMQTDEALIFTLYDSDPQRVQRVAHSAIDDPTSRPNAAPRASFEVRTIAFF